MRGVRRYVEEVRATRNVYKIACRRSDAAAERGGWNGDHAQAVIDAAEDHKSALRGRSARRGGGRR